MSLGTLEVEGTGARYSLVCPASAIYPPPRRTVAAEIRSGTSAEAMQPFLGRLHLFSSGKPLQPTLLGVRYQREAQLITADVVYHFSEPCKELTIECRYFEVADRDHIHLLRIVEGGAVRGLEFHRGQRASRLRQVYSSNPYFRSKVS